jgi:outer membrane lipoprotein SlyB
LEKKLMRFAWNTALAVVVLGFAGLSSDLVAMVSYGQITAVRQVNIQNQGAQSAGTVVGGLAGVASGSGQSGSNRALRTIGGAHVGGRAAGAAGRSTGFEYTVLIGGNRTMQMVTEKGGLRVGDCVSVETGRFNNIRLAPEERCRAAAGSAPPTDAVSAAEACERATELLLEAETDEDFDRAERRMRLVCG